MTRHCQRSESSKVSTIFERKQAEWDNDEQNRLLMDVPAEQERGIAAEGDCRHEVVPVGVEEELQESRLRSVSTNTGTSRSEYLRSALQVSRRKSCAVGC